MVANHSILLADKDRELCKALEKYLTRHGHDVSQTETGHDALSALSNNPPSFIIAGTQLQDMSGLELLRDLRKKFPQIEVIMIVDEGDVGTGVEGLRLGASDYITKPINSDALQIALQRASDRKEMWFMIKRYKDSLKS
jgi:DNA-binding response OmpR family regulator